MASDDTPPSEGPKPVERPSRERHREPRTIDGTAERLPEQDAAAPPPGAEDPIAPGEPIPTPEAQPAAEAEASVEAQAAADEPVVPPTPQGEEPPPPQPERRGGQGLALTAAVLALLASGGSAYYTWQQTSAPETPQVQPADFAALRTRVDQLSARLDKAASAPQRPAATPDQLAALEKRVKSLEQRPVPEAPSAPPPAASGGSNQAPAGPDLSGLQSRLDSVETMAKKAAAAADDANAAVKAIPAPKPPPPAPKVDLTPLENRISALETKLEAPKTVVRATENPIDVPRKGDPTALAVVAEALARAVDQGRPFPKEVAAAESLGADADQLKQLKPLSEKGAPTREALAHAFRQVSAKVLEAAEPAAKSESLVDRLTASATKLVRVRPVGDTGGEDAPSLVARIEAANARGDIREALRDWSKLPAPAKEASSAYGTLLRQKVAAEAAARTVLDGAMSALTRAKD